MSNNYKSEVLQDCGNTEAYREHVERTKNYTKEKWTEANDAVSKEKGLLR